MQNVKTNGLAKDAGDSRGIATSVASKRTARKPVRRTVMMRLDGVTQARIMVDMVVNAKLF